MPTLERLAVTVELDETGEELGEAQRRAAAGDTEWDEWVRDYERGSALIVRLHVVVTFHDGERVQEIDVWNSGVWVETRRHPPQVEQQVADVVSKDFELIGRQLRRHGLALRARDLDEMLPDVELDAKVLARLRDSGQPAQTQRPRPVEVSPSSEAELDGPDCGA